VTSGLRVTAVATACLLVGVAAAAAGPDAKPKPKPKLKPAIRLTKAPGGLALITPGYRLVLTRENGELVELVDRSTGVRLLGGQNGCAWAVKVSSSIATGGCAFSPGGEARFSYGWDRATKTLTLRYEGLKQAPGVDATIMITAARSWFDLQASVKSDREQPLLNVLFPADLLADASEVTDGYMPTFLPGVRFRREFFTTPHRNVETYPSRWAFADFLAAEIGKSHLAMYSINPSPIPVAPVDLGFIRNAGGERCADATFCVTHVFQTWIERGVEWTSPRVRLRVGGDVEQSMLAYRRDNGIDAYPSLRAKLGDRLDTLAQAPLVKADLWKGLPEFVYWGSYLRRLPTPALLHPVAFQSRGHDEDYPDFLPPDPRWGSLEQFNAALDDARSLGDLAMPYLNVSWWDTQSPSVQELPSATKPSDISVQNQGGTAVREQFGVHDGYIVSPSSPAVRDRVNRLFEEWRTVARADCLFFDQIGARPWRRDFNPAAPNPLSYYDSWLSLFGPQTDRCLMAEDGWDRLAASFSAFHGGVLQMSRQSNWPNMHWGEGNWEPYPLAVWLFHDKVLMYQHDLYEATMTADPEVMTFNLAFGLIASLAWDGAAGTLDSPWLPLVGSIQRTLGPLYAGRPLTAFRSLADGVTESVFGGDFSVVANWNRGRAVEVDGRTVAPLGFMARRVGGEVLAGTFGDAWNGVTFPGGAR
jgi:hypothetical protein